MTTLRELLRDALPLPTGNTRFFAHPKTMDLGSGTDELPWKYTAAAEPGGPAIREVRCRVPMDGTSMAHGVADEITFPELVIRFRGKEHALALTPEHLVGAFVGEGPLQGAPAEAGGAGGSGSGSRYWPRPRRLDQSVAFVYGYEWRDERFGPLHDQVKEKLRAEEKIGWFAPALQLRLAPLGRTARLALLRPRLMVAVTFACCAPAADFEPFGALNACRFYPVIQLRTNVDLEGFRAVVEVRRPREGPHGPIQSVLFADHNDYGSLPPPTWDKVFGWYDVNPSSLRSYEVVRTTGTRRDGDPALRMVWVPALELQTGWVRQLERRTAATWSKEARQGAYDSVHLAPRMPREGGDPAVMAPVCHMDCCHIHFRWGTEIGPPHRSDLDLRGWADGLPHQRRGAPMVPEGQSVRISLLGQNGVRYVAEQVGASAAVPHFVFHHGAAYAHSMTTLGGFSPLLMAQPWTEAGWAEFYHRLRYSDSTSKTELLWLPQGPGPLEEL